MKKIFVVDDDPQFAEFARLLLTGLGWDVRVYLRPEEAVGAAGAERPDAILLDYSMDGMTGVQALARLKADPATAWIRAALCSVERCADIDRGLALGAVRFLLKPLTPESLEATFGRG